jgi:hypothetical protein
MMLKLLSELGNFLHESPGFLEILEVKLFVEPVFGFLPHVPIS